jgi:putative transposase
MPRTPRRFLVEPGSTNHCTWRAHNLTHVLATETAKEFFLSLLLQYREKYGMEILSYCIMASHPHVQSRSRLGLKAFSTFWQVVNYRFARWYNKQTGRQGQVVMDRMRSGRVQDGRHCLTVMRYGDQNPVRAGIAKTPKDYRWSSYRHYAFGEPNPLVTDAPEYCALGATPAARRKAYLHLFASKLQDELRGRRRELVEHAFIGDAGWVAAQSATSGASSRRDDAPG